jgi:hypothetical protein
VPATRSAAWSAPRPAAGPTRSTVARLAGLAARALVPGQRHPDVRLALVRARPAAALALARPLVAAVLTEAALGLVRRTVTALALVRLALLVALAIESRHLVVSPGRVEQRLQLVERPGPD